MNHLQGRTSSTQCQDATKSRIRVVRLHRAALESCRVMQRIPNFLPHLLSVVLGTVVLLQVALAQNSGPVQDTTHQGNVTTEPPRIATQPLVESPEQKTTPPANSSALVIGPGDEVEVTVYGAPDLSQHTRVSADGNISMPLIGNVRIAGLSSSEAEGAIETKLRQDKVVNDPQVSVYVKEYTSSGISVVGEVAKPGVYSALGPHRLFDILQAAGGLTDRAAGTVTISHRSSENPITVELPKDPGELSRVNAELLPGDTVVVPRAGIVYVLGEVNKPGGYVLNPTGGVTMLRVIAAAGGPTRAAAVGGTKMLRRTTNGLQELPVPLKDLLRAKVADIPVQADDIIYVPASHLKTALNVGALLSTLGTTAIYRVPF